MHLWIDDALALADWLAARDCSRTLALDTEFMRVRTYWPELALVQLACGDAIALADPCGIRDWSSLAPLLGAANPQKLMHSASEDLVALAPVASAPLAGLFDTQIAAAFAGLGAGVGYQRLVQDLLGVALAKAETRSDWLARPLSEEQRHYAEADVAHLAALHAELHARLERSGRLAWCIEDCAAMTRAAAASAAEPNPHWAYRNGWRWPLSVQVRVRRLLEWRERSAREFNRPRTWVLDNALIANLALETPRTSDELGERVRAQRAFPRRLRDQLSELLLQPTAEEEATLAPIPAPLRGDEEKRFEALRERVAEIATELTLPPALLASRRTLEALVRNDPGAGLTGWRAEVLAGEVADLVARTRAGETSAG
jgi:ribonuclease D